MAQKQTDEQLSERIGLISKRLSIGAYRHVKTGKIYLLCYLAFEESTLRMVVVYQRKDKPALVFTRPAEEFIDKFRKLD